MTPEARRATVKAYARYLASTRKPILVGPWRSEVGFEALYWLPFLRWLKLYGGMKAERFHVVTRGGAGAFYHGMPTIDLYKLRSVETVRLENAYDAQTTGIQKQLSCTAWDKDVLKEAAAHLLGRGAKYHILHPSWMYWALEPFWEEQRGLRYLSTMTDFRELPKPPVSALALPEKFIAVKWYTRATFQPTDQVKQFIAEVTGTIASQIPVVLLTSGHGGDEHTDLLVNGPNIHIVQSGTADQSLSTQMEVISRAVGFVGTYGGTAQLALRMGVPSCSFYDQFGGTAWAHLSLSQWLGIKTHTNFLVGNMSDAALWKQVLSVPLAKPAQDLVTA